MGFEREIESWLIQWKNSEERKPLILRGARQVGKTTLVKSFAHRFDYSIFLNLELKSDAKLFETYSDARILIDALLLMHTIPKIEKRSVLLFIDEIQEKPEAIAMLRYFYEFVPEIHVIAVGSLLEHVMGKVKSFPVGRVQMMYLYPMNFNEFLKAIGNSALSDKLAQVPIPNFAHGLLKELFHRYIIVGGMPEAVKQYVKNMRISDLPPIYESIWETYKNDIEKYASSNSEVRVIKHIISTAHLYIDERIKFQHFGNSNYRSREVGEAFRNLEDAKIIQLIYPTTDFSVPMRPDLKKSPRLQFLDTGLLNHLLKIQAELMGLEDFSAAYKGAIIPHIITQEYISTHSTYTNKPNFWVREKKQSTAEVDLVHQVRQYLIPIVIKSGKEGTLKSLHQFIDVAEHPYAIRVYGGEFKIEQHKTPAGKPYYLMNLPYYSGLKIEQYASYFIENYSVETLS